ncbi:hypothetical protein H6G64_35345 [Calothrix sp. FACHB-156]|nr:hypothetical protein [Calothrix sp. FACHB-156]
MDLKTVIQSIRYLPQDYFNDVFSNKQIELLTDNQKDIFKFSKFQYLNICLWLQYFLNDKQELFYDLVNSDAKHYKDLADRTVKTYQFLQEIKLLSPTFQELDINEFLYRIEVEIFEKLIRNSGFYGNPSLMGKRAVENKVKEQAEIFSDIEKINYTGSYVTYSPTELMKNESITIAKNPENFKFREIYRKFESDITKIQTRIRKSELQIVYLNKDKIITNPQGKRKKLTAN